MDEEDYLKLLLNNSFQESERFWSRNSAFLVIQGLLIGFFVYSSEKILEYPYSALFLIVSIAGIIISVCHFFSLRISEWYNFAWFKGFNTYALALEQHHNDDFTWKHLNAVIRYHEGENTENEIPNKFPDEISEKQNAEKDLKKSFTQNKFPRPYIHATKIAIFVSLLFLGVWVVFFSFIIGRMLKIW